MYQLLGSNCWEKHLPNLCFALKDQHMYVHDTCSSCTFKCMNIIQVTKSFLKKNKRVWGWKPQKPTKLDWNDTPQHFQTGVNCSFNYNNAQCKILGLYNLIGGEPRNEAKG